MKLSLNVNVMLIRLMILFTIPHHWCNAQAVNIAEEIIISEKTGYYCKVRDTDQSIILFQFDVESSEYDSIYIFDKPGGLLESHPNVIDVMDSIFFQVRIYTSGDGMQYPELRAYKTNKMKEYSNKDIGYEYIASQSTLLDNSLPLNSYIRRIIRREDALKGPLCFDLIATSDSLQLFIYIDYLQKIEVWNFVRYPLVFGKYSLEEGQKIMKKKPWELSRVISAKVQAPFRLIELDDTGKIYALTNSGELFDLSKESAQKVNPKSSLKDVEGIVTDKKLKSMRCFSAKQSSALKKDFMKIYKSLETVKHE